MEQKSLGIPYSLYLFFRFLNEIQMVRQKNQISSFLTACFRLFGRVSSEQKNNVIVALFIMYIYIYTSMHMYIRI